MKNIYAILFLGFIGIVPSGKLCAQSCTSIITTIAGNGTSGYSGDGSAATAAKLYEPTGVAKDGSGNLYIADLDNNRIRKVNSSGTISTIAGNGTPGYSGDGGAATAAELDLPFGVSVDGSGNVYIADYGNQRIRKVNTSGIISTIAGNGGGGYSGDGGAATAAEIYDPRGVAADGSGNVYIADFENNRIRKVNTSGIISTIAGNGTGGFSGDGGAATAGELNYPYGVATDGSGNVYIADYDNNRIRKVNTSGIISTIAGNGTSGYSGDGGAATAGKIYNPIAVTTDGSGNVYIADEGNNRIREVNTSGIISTFAGNGTGGYFGDGGAATAGELRYPFGVTTDGSGNVYIADQDNQRIRKVSNATYVGTITGTTTLCAGSNTALSDATTGGTWSSSNTSVGTVGSTGLVYGVAAGTAVISYVTACGNANVTVTVNPLPGAGTITGATATTLGGNTTLSDTATGGVWSSSNTGVATVGSGGLVIGVDLGAAIISYAVTNGCGTAYATDIVTVSCGGGTPGFINTIAGNGTYGYSGDGGAATAGELASPPGVAVDNSGNVYIVDYGNLCIRKVNPSGIISTFAGNGTSGYSGDGGAATAAELNYPNGVATDGSGNVYIADADNSAIRKVNTSGVISTIAGNGSEGYSGDGGAATAGELSYPVGVAVDASGNVYIADQDNGVIRKVNTSGIISTFAGNGSAGFSGDGGAATAAKLNYPQGVATDGSGNVYIADASNNRIRKVNSSGIISTIAGNGSAGFSGDGGAATAAELNYTAGVAVDGLGNVNIADQVNGVIRKVNTSGIISTIAGGGSGYSGDGGAATAVELNYPTGVAVDGLGNVYIANVGNSFVLKVNSGITVEIITGTTTLCAGGNTALNDVTTDGTWSSSNTGVATVGSTGVAHGVAAGTAMISYITPCGNASVTVTVNPLPGAGTIAGAAMLCTGANTTLTDSISGGVWSSGNTAVATVGSAGAVYGVAAGTALISYTVTNSCGSATVSSSLLVNPLPGAGIITGATATTIGGNTTLSDATTGGVWSSSNTGAATVGSGGLVTGVDLGTAIISYVVSNGCGTAYATDMVTVYCGGGTPAIITTFAGNGTGGFSGDGGAATAGELFIPWGAVVDGSGNVYIADNINQRIRKVNTSGVISTIAGIVESGFSGDGGAATAAKLNGPAGVAVDGSGNVYIADLDNDRIRKVNASGIISTFAGNGTDGYSGDGGAATAAELYYPWGVAVDGSGNVYIADEGNQRIRKVNTSGIISTIAGNGTNSYSGDGGEATAAELGDPYGVATDGLGNVYIADGSNNRIRMVNTSGIISTIAGNGTEGYSGDGGAATAAELYKPEGVATDGSGNVYIADADNNRIRVVNTSGIISTFAGNGTGGYSGDGSAATAGELYNPNGVATDGSGNVYIADADNNRIRKVINGSYVDPITGTTTLCAGTNTALNDVTTGGTWSSSNTAVATVGSTGVVYGVAAGTTTISYITPCGDANVTVKVNPLPGAGTITGSSMLCSGANTTFIDGVSGGVWSSSNTGVATVGSAGLVYGVAAGTALISYTVTNSCGSATVSNSLLVNPLPGAGTITGITTTTIGGNTTLSDADTGGVWSSSNSGVATVGSEGLITGVALGTAIISYVVTNGCGTAYVTDMVTVSCGGGTPAIITTIAGNGAGGYSGDGGAATAAELNAPQAVVVDNSGNVYIADWYNNRIRKVNTSGIISTIAGNGTPDYSGDGGAATAGKLDSPYGVAVDGSGNVYIADSYNNRIRKVNTSGIISTFAGNGTGGYSGDGGAATAAKLYEPTGVATDGSGNVYIADFDNNRIRKVNTSGIISTIAGNGTGGYSGDGGAATAAELSEPTGFASDGSGNVYIADYFNQRIRKVNTSGIISTIAGNGTSGYSGDGGAATAGKLNYPWGVAVDGSGNVYIADGHNQRIRMVNTSGIISTFTGNGTGGYSGDGGAATAGELYFPTGVALDASGNVYIADLDNERIRKVSNGTYVDTITGTTTLCAGTNTDLYDVTMGGTWSSSNTAVATVGSTGVVYGVAAGTATISYVTPCGDASTTVLVNPLPSPGTTTGSSTLCAGANTTFTDGIGGGVWSSSNTGVATVGSAGVVYGVAAGTALISYTVTNSCGSATISNSLLVNPLPSAGTITGSSTTTMGGTTTLTDGVSGGVWSSSNIGVATVGSGGLVTGVALGTAIISYAVTNGCGTAYATAMVTVSCGGGTPGIITTIAGNGTGGYSGDGGAATAGELYSPIGVAIDGSGNVYIADLYNNRIRKVNTSGIISTIAGNGTAGYSGDGGAATAAELNGLHGVAADGSGNVYIADYNDNLIRKVNPSGIISTIAGNGTAGYSGDGGAATATELNYPIGVAIDGAGNVYIADQHNHRIRKMNTSGIISTIAGNGTLGFSGDGGAATAAELNAAQGVTVDGSGNVYIADNNNQRIRKVNTSGIISTFAGNGTGGYSGDGGAATAAELYNPSGVATDGLGNVYIADESNQRIRMVNTSGIISKFAGNGTSGYSGDGGAATDAELASPWGVATDGLGNVYIADQGNNRIRELSNGITVNAITGTTTLCAGTNTALSDATTGGTWSSSNTAVATVGSTGVVYGVAAGTATISYVTPCGDASTTVLVNPLPSPGTIMGSSTLCGGANTTFTDGISGGVWSSSNTGVATVGSAGAVYGVAAGTALISYTVSNSCGSATVSNSLLVNPLPSAGTITGSSTLCAGANTTFTDGVSGGLWSSSNTGVATVGSAGLVYGVVAGTALVSYTVTNSCGSATVSNSLLVNPLPDAGTITGSSTLCAGANTTFTDSVSGGLWSSSNTSVAIVGSAGLVYGVAAGTALISYTVTNSCGSATVSNSLLVNPLPDAGTITGSSTLCAGANTTFTDSVSGGLWSSSNTSVAIVGSAGLVYGVAAGTALISYTVTNSCGSATVSNSLLVNPLPDAGTITGSSTLCAGANTTFTDGVSGGVWSSSNTGVATVGSAGVVYGVAAGTALISFTVTNSCGSATISNSLLVNPLPSAGTITGSSTLCAGANTTFTDGVSGGVWSSSNTGVATVGSAGLVYGVAAGTALISYTVSNSCGNATVSNSLIVNPLPSAGTITGSSTLCTGANTTFTDGIGGGVWNSSNTGVATVGSAGSVYGVAAGTALISYTVSNSCGNATVSNSLIVNPLPSAGTITGSSTLCAGANTTFTDGIGGGVWNSSNTGVATVGSAGLVYGVATGTAFISYTVTNSCGSATVSNSLLVNPLPDAGTIAGSSTLCSGANATFTDGVSGGVWSSSNTGVATVGSAGLVYGVAAGTAFISYTVTNSCGSATVSNSQLVNPLPDAGTITGSSTLCAGANTTFTDGVSGGVWSSSNTGVVTVGSAGVVYGVAAGTALISYTVTNSCGSATVSNSLLVNPLPDAGTIAGSSTLCSGANATFTDGVSGGVWSSSNTGVATVGSAGLVYGVAAGTAFISYTVTNSCGSATVSNSQLVNPLPDAGTITGSSTLCAGANTTFTDGVSGGVWSSSNTGVVTVGSAGVVYGVAAGTALISYTVTNSCGTAYVSTTISVSPLPFAGVITGTTSTTVGVATTLSDTVSGGVWSSSNGAVWSVNSGGLVTGIAAGTTIISYAVTNTCGTAYATATVTVNNIPVSAITGATSVCVGANILLNDSTSGGTWSSSNAALATVGSLSGIVSGLSAGTVVITYRVGGNFATWALMVNPLPNAGSIAGSGSVCPGGSITLTDGVSGGAWSSSNTACGTVGAGGAVVGISAGTAVISYTVTNVCGSATAVHVVVVSPSAYAGIISGASSVYSGSAITLTESVSGGAWTSGNTGVATVSGGAVTGVSAGTALISYTVSNSCGSAVAVHEVTVNNLSGVLGISSICSGSSAELTDSISGGTWTSSNNMVATVDSSTGVITGSLAGVATISYWLSGSYTTFTVTVNPVPAAITGSSNVCTGFNIGLTETTSGGAWVTGNVSIATVGSAGSVTGVSNGTTQIDYILPTGCESAHTVSVTASPAVISGPSGLCTANTYTYTDATGGGSWSNSGIPITIGSATGIVSSGVSGGATISYTSSGCTSTLAVTVSPSPAAIAGSSNMCTGTTTTYTDGTTSGTWSSANTSVASITTGGVASGLTAGTTTISYVMSTGCYGTAAVTVTASPAAISGVSLVCTGQSYTFTDVPGGGTWSSSNTVTATVGSSTGLVMGTISGSATITYILNGCRSATTVNVAQSPVAIAGSINVCTGIPATLSDGTSGGTWSSSATTVATISTGGVVTGVSAGTTTISYSMSTGCYAVTVETVDTAPAAISGNNVCTGSPVTFTDITGGGTWSSSNTSNAAVGSLTGVVTGGLSGTVTITYTASGCATTLRIGVSASPAAITGSTSACIGATATLSDGTSGGTWSSSATTVATISTGGVVTGVSVGTTTISYSMSTGCYAVTVETVNTAPAAISGSNVCTGTPVTFTDITSGGTWSSSNTSNATVGSLTGVVTGGLSGTVTITYTASGCATTLRIGVSASPVAITGSTSACTGSTATLSDGTTGGTWSSSATVVATISTGGVVTGVSAGTTTISYSMSTGCYAVTVETVNTAPAAISGSNVCTGTPVTFTDITGGGTWSSSNISNAAVGSLTGVVTGGLSGTVTITYTVSGCATNLRIGVSASPVAITGSTSACTGATATLSDGTTGGTWSSSATVVATISTGGVVTGVSAGTTTISYSMATGCYATTVETVNTAPAAISGSNVCVGTPVIFTDITGGGTWSSSNTSNATVGSLTGVVTGGVSGTVTITYTASGCAATLRIGVSASPAAIAGSTSACTGATATLSDGTSGGTWSSSATTVATISTGGVVTGVSAGTTTISYSMSTGCYAVTVETVNTAPAAISGVWTICLGSSYTFADATSGGRWSSSNSATSVGSASGVVSGVLTGASVITYNVSGCYVAYSVSVTALPSAITGATTLCAGYGGTMSDPTGGGTWSSSNTSVLTISTTGSTAAISAGTSLVTYTAPTGCITSITTNVIALPAVINGPAVICTGLTGYLSDSSGGGYWSTTSGIITVTGSTGAITGVSAGTANVTYTLGGCHTYDTVTVYPVPGAISGGIVGTTILTTFTDGTSGGTWSTSNNLVATVGSATGVVSGVIAGTVSISYTLSTGCPAIKVVTVLVTPATLSGSSVLCSGFSYIFNDSTAGGVWSCSTIAAQIDSFSGIATGELAGTGTISYTVGGASRLFPITVFATPALITGGIICTGQSTTFHDATSGGVWTSGNAAVATVGSLSGVVSGVSSGAVIISYTSAAACPAMYATIANNNPGPIIGTGLVCQSNSYLFTDDTAGGLWSASVIAAAVGSLTGVVTGEVIGTSVISYTLSSGCSATFGVSVAVTPDAITGGPVCVGQSTTYANLTGGGNWNVALPTVATVGSGTGIVDGVATGTTMLSYALPTGCAAWTTLTVNAEPAAITGVSQLCNGEVYMFTDGSGGGTWSASNTAVTVGATTGSITGVLDGASMITYTLLGCSTEMSVTVDAAAGAIGGSSSIMATTATTLSNSAAGGTWSSSNTAVATVGTAISSATTVTGVATGTTVITYTTPAGCYATLTLVVTPYSGRNSTAGIQQPGSNGDTVTAEKLYALRVLPNPNNGTFTIEGTVPASDEDVQLVVSDMLGQVVYTAKAHTTAGQLNTAINLGSNLPNGMYLLNITGNTGTHVFHFVVER